MKKLKIVLTIAICMLLFLSGCAVAKASKEGNQDKKQEKDALTGTAWTSVSGCFRSDKAENNEPDALTKTSWISYDDGSYWVFNEDHSFFWYQDRDEKDDNYYGGVYKLYRGEAAMDFIEKELSSYNVTKSGFMEVINKTDRYMVEDFICIYTKNTTFMLEGKEQVSKPNMIPYMGFMLNDETVLDIANMKTGSYYGFTKEE